MRHLQLWARIQGGWLEVRQDGPPGVAAPMAPAISSVNIAAVLTELARTRPERTALIDLDGPEGPLHLSYSALADRVQRVATGLVDRGLEPGDRVALLVGNGHEYVEAFLAIATAGLVAVPMNIRLLPREHAHMVADSGARLLIIDATYLTSHRDLLDLPELGQVVTRGENPEDAFEELYDAVPAEPAEVHPDRLLSLMYTSGTTGSPKGVMLSHRSWDAVARQVCHYLRYEDQHEVTLHTAPLTHGAGFLLLPTLRTAGCNIVMRAFEPKRTLEVFGSHGVTNGFFVPSMIRMLLDTPVPDALDAPALKSLYYAGAPIDSETLIGAMDRFGPVLVQSFAQMEAPMFLTVLDHQTHVRIAAGDQRHLIGSAGRPVEGAVVRVVDETGNDQPAEEPGEITAQAPQTMLGYWNRPEATAQTLADGWLHTGDIGRFDADGNLFVVDRLKDMIITGGSNVYAREVETVLLAIDGIREAAIVGLPHPLWGEAVTAVLVREPGAAVGDEAVTADCRSQLADYRRPKKLVWCEELPRNAYGKILKRELRQKLQQQVRWDQEG